MAILRTILVMLVLIAGCYAPEITDCDLTCTTDLECAGDQVCAPQGLCAGSIAACEQPTGTIDAGTMPRMIELRVMIQGDGKVAIDGGPECAPDDDGPMGETCMLVVPAGPLVIEAIADEKPFERWTSIVCAGQSARCEVTLQLDAAVAAKFK